MRKTDVKARIIREATRLFARKGYDATSTNEIVKSAGVGKPMLYYYYKNKEGLYREALASLVAPIADEISALGGDENADPKTQIRRVIEVYAEFFRKNPLGAPVINQAVMRQDARALPVIMPHFKRIFSSVRDIIARGVARGQFKRRDLDLTAMSAIHLIISYQTKSALIQKFMKLRSKRDFNRLIENHITEILSD